METYNNKQTSKALFYTAGDYPLRDLKEFMVSPILSFNKRPVLNQSFESRRYSLNVTSSRGAGITTIYDYDVFIVLISFLNDVHNQGKRISTTIHFVPHSLITELGWSTGGNAYSRLAEAIKRLCWTNLYTDQRLSNIMGIERSFSLISEFEIPKKYQSKSLMADYIAPPPYWSVVLPQWVISCILNKREILALHPNYLGLKNTLDRALYRIARKSVPETTGNWLFRLETLKSMTGYQSSKSRFKQLLIKAANRNSIPEYSLTVRSDGRNTSIVFVRDPTKPGRVIRGLITKNGSIATNIGGPL